MNSASWTGSPNLVKPSVGLVEVLHCLFDWASSNILLYHSSVKKAREIKFRQVHFTNHLPDLPSAVNCLWCTLWTADQ